MRRRNRTNARRSGIRNSRRTFRDTADHGCVLLYGPPGCGKTYFLRSTGHEFRLSTELIPCRKLKEQLIKGVKTQLYFKKLFARARQHAPSMIVLDNIDEITSRNSLQHLKLRKAVFQLLRELDHIKPGDRLLITATSNRPYLIEPQLFRTKRFDKLIFVPMPNSESREALFELYLEELPKADDINTKSLGRITQGYNGHDIKRVVSYANYLANRQNSDITTNHLERAVKELPPSLNPDMLEPIKKFFMRYKSGILTGEGGMDSGSEYETEDETEEEDEEDEVKRVALDWDEDDEDEEEEEDEVKRVALDWDEEDEDEDEEDEEDEDEDEDEDEEEDEEEDDLPDWD